MQANQQTTTTATMNTTTKVVFAALIIVIIALYGYTVELREDVKISREVIKTLFEDIHRSDELLLKTHKEYSWGVGNYGESDYSPYNKEGYSPPEGE